MFNMKRFSYLFAAIALFFGAVNAEAQDSTLVESSPVERPEVMRPIGHLSKGDFFVGIGGSANIYFGEHDRMMRFHHRIAPAMDLYVGKWITPSFAIRLAYSGGQALGLSNPCFETAHNTGVIYKDSKDVSWLRWQKFNVINFRADFMLNLVNLIGGYKEDWFYTVSPYIGAGAAKVVESSSTRIGLSAGLFNTFRISKSLDIVLDVHGTIVPEDFEGESGLRPGAKPDGIYTYDGLLTASLGVSYSF